MLRRVVVLKSGGRAKGVVTEHERREIDESVGFHPAVFFRDYEGTGHHFISNAGWSHPAPPIGTNVEVVYLSSDPTVAYINSFLHLWAAPVALYAFAATLAFAAIKVGS